MLELSLCPCQPVRCASLLKRTMVEIVGIEGLPAPFIMSHCITSGDSTKSISSSFPILALSGSLEGCDEPNCVCLDTSNTKRNHIVNGTVDSVSEYVKGIYSVYSVVCSNVLYKLRIGKPCALSSSSISIHMNQIRYMLAFMTAPNYSRAVSLMSCCHRKGSSVLVQSSNHHWWLSLRISSPSSPFSAN